MSTIKQSGSQFVEDSILREREFDEENKYFKKETLRPPERNDG